MQSVQPYNWLDLDDENWVNVTSNFKLRDYLSFSLCCKKFFHITSDQSLLLQFIQLRVSALLQYLVDPYYKMCASLRFAARYVQQEERITWILRAQRLFLEIEDEDLKEFGNLTLITEWLCVKNVEQAEMTFREIKDVEIQIKALFAIAEHKTEEEAALSYLKIDGLLNNIRDVKERSLILIQLGERLKKIDFYDCAKKAIASIKNRAIRATMYFRLALSYRKSSFHKEEGAIVVVALKLLSKIGPAKERATFFLNMSTYQIRIGDTEAAGSLKKSLELIGKLSDPFEQVKLFNKVAKKQCELGLIGEAVETIKRAADLLNHIKELSDRYQAQSRIIKGLMLQKRIKEAICLALTLNPRLEVKALLAMH